MENVTRLGYKTGLFNLNASYSDVSEGDVVAFFKNSDPVTGQCSVQLGSSFIFKNARFPQIFFGDSTTDVNSYVSGATSSKVIMCFCAVSKGFSSKILYLFTK